MVSNFMHLQTDGDHSGNESDQVTTSSTQTICVESDSLTHSRKASVALLSILKALDMSELSMWS